MYLDYRDYSRIAGGGRETEGLVRSPVKRLTGATTVGGGFAAGTAFGAAGCAVGVRAGFGHGGYDGCEGLRGRTKCCWFI